MRCGDNSPLACSLPALISQIRQDESIPGCYFEVMTDAPDKSLPEMVEMLRVNLALTFEQMFERKKP